MNLTVLSTGGTIASTSGEDGATPSKSGEEIVDAVPQIQEHATVTVEQVAQTPSYQMDTETLESIGDRVRELEETATEGIIITHGTDTLEETAYYLDIAVTPSIPVLVTGAQRRPDEVSPDGPANLLTAVRAIDEFTARSCGGVFVAINEEIHAARYATKVHTSKLEAFASPDAGPVAILNRNAINVKRKPESETPTLPTQSLDADVYQVKSGSTVGDGMITAAVDQGADGIVIEGTGLGNVTEAIGRVVQEAPDSIPIVITTRCASGEVDPVYGDTGGGETLRQHGAIFAGNLPTQKARLTLILARSAYDEREEIREVFKEFA